MKRLMLLPLFFLSQQIFAQSPIDVVESTFKVDGFGEQVFYYGFAEGDQVIFNFEEANGKELKEVEIVEYPTASKFMDYKTKKITDKSLQVLRTGIYQFRFKNSAISGRVCKYKIQRIPSSVATKGFNTSVYWKTQKDSSFTLVPERYLVKSSYITKTVVPSTEFYINSGRNATFQGGKSRISFAVPLPSNTVEWYYQISCFRNKEDIQKTKSTFNLLGQLTSLVDQTGGLKFGLDMLTQPPGADYCDVYLMNQYNSQLFEAKENYSYAPAGSRENMKSGIIKLPATGSVIPFIGIKNPDAGVGVNVLIECVAITLEEEWAVREVKKWEVKTQEAPYLQN